MLSKNKLKILQEKCLILWVGNKMTIVNIQKKADMLKKKLRTKTVCENFGEKEQRLLDDFIGDVYEYSYNDRLIINDIINDFAQWCGVYPNSKKI